jgi:hypothetical protein
MRTIAMARSTNSFFSEGVALSLEGFISYAGLGHAHDGFGPGVSGALMLIEEVAGFLPRLPAQADPTSRRV